MRYCKIRCKIFWTLMEKHLKQLWITTKHCTWPMVTLKHLQIDWLKSSKQLFLDLDWKELTPYFYGLDFVMLGRGVPFGLRNLAWPMMPTNEGPTERKWPSWITSWHHWSNDPSLQWQWGIGCQQSAYRNPLRWTWNQMSIQKVVIPNNFQFNGRNSQ